MVYVELDSPACEGFIPRSGSGPWDDSQRAELLQAALGMCDATGHTVLECVDELRRMVMAEALSLVGEGVIGL